jgi:hypothetical protein
VNPIALLLVILGYGLAFPIGTKMLTVVRTENRLAFTGHQAGVLIATLGWVIAGRGLLVWPHLLWLLIASIWFNWAVRPPV